MFSDFDFDYEIHVYTSWYFGMVSLGLSSSITVGDILPSQIVIIQKMCAFFKFMIMFEDTKKPNYPNMNMNNMKLNKD